MQVFFAFRVLSLIITPYPLPLYFWMNRE